MVHADLQAQLVEELRKVFSLKDILGRDRPLRVISQFMPVEKGLNVLDLFPFVRVILVDGVDPNEDDPSQCRVVFSVGLCGTDEQGHQDLCHVLQMIQEHLTKCKVFDNRYELLHPIKWRLKTEDVYPTFFGELETLWTVGKFSKVEDLT